jgi:hypothetical protein
MVVRQTEWRRVLHLLGSRLGAVSSHLLRHGTEYRRYFAGLHSLPSNGGLRPEI